MRYLFLAGALLAACGPSEPSSESSAGRQASLVPGTPNLLVVTLDTTRADHLGCYGYFRNTSPRIDALAEESVLFERCIVPMATTLPTHVSLFTATYPHEHGVIANLTGKTVYERDAGLATFAEYLRDIGYTTAAFVSAFPLRAEAGLAEGFEVYSYPRNKLRRAGNTIENARSWLKSRADEPFFLWVHLFDPHGPYNPPPPYDEQFQTDEALLEWIATRQLSAAGERLGGKELETEPSLNMYDGEIAYMDAQLGLLFDDLQAAMHWDDLVIVVMGDHGEGLNQHGISGHGRAYDEQLHAPLLLRAPGLEPGRYGDPVSAADVLPTLLGMMELPGSGEFLGQATGVDRLEPQGPDQGWVLSQSSPRQSDGGGLEYALTGERWKYLREADGSERLFDLASDPHELEDLSEREPQRLGELRERTDAWLARQMGARGGSQRDATQAELEGLQSLGYGGSDDGQ